MNLETHLKKCIGKHLNKEDFVSNLEYVPWNNPVCGAYVSLYSGEERRGCLGLIKNGSYPLKMIERIAVLSATKDDRFHAIQEDEISSLQIKTWIITAMEKIEELEDLDFENHGLFVIDEHGNQALLLPYFVKENKNRWEALKKEIESKSNILWSQLDSYDIYAVHAKSYSKEIIQEELSHDL